MFVEVLGDCLVLTLFSTCLFCIYYNLLSFTNLQLNLGLDFFMCPILLATERTLTRHANIDGSGDSCT
jgi:hypothetical protein